MTGVLSADVSGTRIFLLSHVDPLFAIEIADRLGRHPEQGEIRNTVVFGQYVPPALRPMLRQLVSAALDKTFINDLCDVLENARIHLDLAGLNNLRRFDSTLTVNEPPESHRELFSGALEGTDAACDLLLQPLMAYSDLFNDLSALWVKVVENPDWAGHVYYRTNRSSYFETRLENRIRLALGTTTDFMEMTIVNIP